MTSQVSSTTDGERAAPSTTGSSPLVSPALAQEPAHVVELAFAMHGRGIALDHGYLLYSALVAHVPELHGDSLGWQILPVRGQQAGPGRIEVLPTSSLGIRCPAATIPVALGLAGKTLRIGEDVVALGVPVVRPLAAANDLVSRFVTVKGFEEPATFEEALIRQLIALVGDGDGAVAEVGERRVMRVAAHTIVGFRVALRGLHDEASLRIQAQGLGGRRRMGAGVFFREGRRE